MRSYIAFTKKEFLESFRTYRLVIMVAALAFFGLLSPFTARILPDILSGMDIGGGVVIELPEPSANDSWAQFFSNISQMGMLVVIIVFCGITANELSKGTLINIVTKGIRRHTVLLAKFTVATLMWTLGYALSLGICLGYTIYFWGTHDLPHAWLTFGAPWLFGVLLIIVMILGGICTSSITGSLVGVGVIVIGLNLINIAPAAQKYNPISLAGGTFGILDSSATVDDFFPAALICVGVIVVTLVASIVVFDRKQL
ncbi:MAG: hypothetical protein LBG99_00565 [Propionibacteriaceae bacterium]|jgi:ABC-2 type transport system permease protein|nr:hypothetical protein [Propionibacteriaceae bacterium]